MPFTLPGERAAVRLTREKKSYAEAEVVRLVEVSPDRVVPRCELYGRCGGCAYQHAAYGRQIEIKTSQVKELLRRVGGAVDADVRPMLASPLEWEYRNRIAVHARDGKVGFHGRKSHAVVPAVSCPIASPDINRQLADLASHPPDGATRITLREKSGHFGFSQVNPAAAEILAGVVREMLSGGGGHLVDAYCGAGFFAKKLRGLFAKTTGIEWSARAIRAARSDAVGGETYLEGAVEDHLAAALAAEPTVSTALVLDPPAEGLSREAVGILLANTPSAIVYVSCDPATLARDLKAFSSRFALQRIQPVDMFPQTAEIESVAFLKSL